MGEDRFRLLIDGEWVDGDAGAYEVVNPATEDVVGVAPEASVGQARAACAAAARAFPRWSQTPPEERAALLSGAADLLERRAAELVPLVQAETGATLAITRSMQVPVAYGRLRRYARGALEPDLVPLPPGVTEATALAPGGLISAAARRAPVGVVSCITSYNFPLVNMAGKIAPALAMGNCVVVKPAPQDPLGVIRLVEILHEAGFPPGVVGLVNGRDVAPSEAITTSADVDMVSFTGSSEVGRRIGAAAGGGMKRLLMELGGKGACLVLEDADLRAAVVGIASVWGFHAGQICTAPTRVIVHRSLYEPLLDALKQAAGGLVVGDPCAPETHVGPLISHAHRARVEGFVASGRAEGAELLHGGGRAGMSRGWYAEPTLLGGCRNDMRVAREEIFGPVVVVVPVDDEEEAIDLANDSSYGLYDYVYSGDSGRAWRVASRLRAGNVGLNTLQRNHEAPFGGFKQSGVGRDGGSFGLHAYSELQSIVWSS